MFVRSYLFVTTFWIVTVMVGLLRLATPRPHLWRGWFREIALVVIHTWSFLHDRFVEDCGGFLCKTCFRSPLNWVPWRRHRRITPGNEACADWSPTSPPSWPPPSGAVTSGCCGDGPSSRCRCTRSVRAEQRIGAALTRRYKEQVHFVIKSEVKWMNGGEECGQILNQNKHVERI